MLAKSPEHPPAYRQHNMSMTGVGVPERRKRIRMQIHWPVLLIQQGTMGVLETVTENLSSDGFYCHSIVPLTSGQLIGCTLRVPAHHPTNSGEMLSLECKVRVVRVESLDGPGSYGIGCRIEDYRFPGMANRIAL